jgi:hypothetical protein
MKSCPWLLLCLLALSPALAVPSLVEQVAPGVTVVRDDAGNWGGMTNGITHMNREEYTARKILDLSDVPVTVWEAARELRLSVYFMVHDYSWHDLPQANGLDEAYEVTVNGKSRVHPTNGGAPVYWNGKQPAMAWYDFSLRRDELRRGPNEILIRKAPGSKGDDYLYLGIDNTIKRGNSAVAFDGKNWTQEKLTIPGGNGEYMVRLYLLEQPTSFQVRYRPGHQPPLDDPQQLVRFVGARRASTSAAGLTVPADQILRLEWRPEELDATAPLEVTAQVSGAVEIAWLNNEDKPVQPVRGEGVVKLSAPGSLRPGGLTLRPTGGAITLKEVTFTGHRAYYPRPAQVNLCPVIAPPACGAKLPVKPASCLVTGQYMDTATLDNGLLTARFAKGSHLRLVSLMNHVTKTEMVRQPDALGLFWVMVGDKAYTGSRDFELRSFKVLVKGFEAELRLPNPALQATLRATMEDEGLRLGLKLVNAGPAPVDFKLSFPHLAGLGVSDQAAEDYYFYPWGGGLINDAPALIRRGYGDYEALYQVMDLYSPARGGGLYLRLDDSQGWHKLLTLRKVVPGQPEANGDSLIGVQSRVREEYRVPNPLPAVPGTGMSAEYLRRTRAPGGSFTPAEAVLSAHAGDWHTALQSYAGWAHRVWKWRPFPSRLKSVRHMMPAGWGQGILFKDGKYRTDIIKPPQPGIPGPTITNSLELMSWWEWSPLGFFMTPLDQIVEKFGQSVYNRWKSYFVKDPVTGQMMWNNQPGDYLTYNDRFGGLPAFRQAIQTYQKMGSLVTLYTDPFRLDENCPTGQAHGRQWCVINQKGELSTEYEVFNPCYDLPAARQWAADTMERVMRETGADGIRLDEVGHRGWACYNPDHRHTYQEPGITQWQKATTEMVKMVHAGMDRVRADLVLTTEFPGYDYMMPHLEGAITYDLSLQATPLRPLEINLQRFYFPECKPYELDYRGMDPQLRKVFWNGADSFERYFPLPYMTVLNENEAAYQGRDCTALLSTPGNAPGLYINRFGDGDKTLYHLYNASGFTYEGVVLAVKLSPGQHLFDLLGCAEVAVSTPAGQSLSHARLYLPRNDVGCIVRLTRRLQQISRQEQTLTVTVNRLPGACQLALADAQGRLLYTQPARMGLNKLPLDQLTVSGQPACLKLLAGGTLVDVAALPAP